MIYLPFLFLLGASLSFHMESSFFHLKKNIHFYCFHCGSDGEKVSYFHLTENVFTSLSFSKHIFHKGLIYWLIVFFFQSGIKILMILLSALSIIVDPLHLLCLLTTDNKNPAFTWFQFCLPFLFNNFTTMYLDIPSFYLCCPGFSGLCDVSFISFQKFSAILF